MKNSAIPFDLLLRMFKTMVLIRRAEERLAKLFSEEEVTSPVHLSIGQEGVAAGVCSALERDDSVVSTHRCHGHYLAKGGDLKKMFAELMGKTDGCARGKGGSMHLFDPAVNMNLSLPIVGGSIPIAVGFALSRKMKQQTSISVAFFGDGAVDEGVFWESLNFAVVHRLPVLFVCENNLYATHAHILKRQPSANIAERISGFRLPALIVDGNNAVAVYKKARFMVMHARTGKGPSFLEAKTYRWREHWGPGEDWHLGYRSREEVKFWISRCPIKRLRNTLSTLGAETTLFQQIEDDVENLIKQAVEFARGSAVPEQRELLSSQGG